MEYLQRKCFEWEREDPKGTRLPKGAFSAHGQIFGLQGVGIHVQEHVRERQTQFNGVGPAVQHAGVACASTRRGA